VSPLVQLHQLKTILSRFSKKLQCSLTGAHIKVHTTGPAVEAAAEH